jgi:hypothetical protein
MNLQRHSLIMAVSDLLRMLSPNLALTIEKARIGLSLEQDLNLRPQSI